MSGPSKIQWTQQTWNPIVGCSIHSPGCKNCYAMKDAWRLMHNPHPAIAAKFAGTATTVKGKPVWTGRVNLDEAALLAPLKRTKPTIYFVNSMSDLFHESVSDETIDQVFAVMAACPQHKFQLLTKRSDRMRSYTRAFEDRPDAFGQALARVVRTAGFDRQKGIDVIDDMSWPLPNVWLGVSVEDQHRAAERVPDLLATPAAVRFLSCEPLIGPVDLAQLLRGLPSNAWLTWLDGLDWVICGGESGSGARPMNPDWARTIRDQCAATGVAFFFKQWGGWLPAGQIASQTGLWSPACGSPLRTTKRNAGRLLDGIEHNGMPA